jgi:hypothetical protein
LTMVESSLTAVILMRTICSRCNCSKAASRERGPREETRHGGSDRKNRREVA